jgi:hypothetical protein
VNSITRFVCFIIFSSLFQVILKKEFKSIIIEKIWKVKSNQDFTINKALKGCLSILIAQKVTISICIIIRKITVEK